MITAVNLNPCIDKYAEINGFTYGGMNRILSSRSDASGKGVNVALGIKEFSLPAACIGFNYTGPGGQTVKRRLDDNGILCEFIYSPGDVRVNTKVLDAVSGIITELNEAGVTADDSAQNRMIELTREFAQKSDYMVFTGSLPPGCPVDFYKTLISAANKASGGNCRCVLDAEGEKLTQGIKARPFLIKPNTYELELACARKLPTLRDVRDAAIEMVKRGVSIVAVSMGGDGAIITDGEQSLFSPALQVEVKSTVGAGDSMVAGLVAALARGASFEEAFRQGVACATACVMSPGTQLFSLEQVNKLQGLVNIQAI